MRTSALVLTILFGCGDGGGSDDGFGTEGTSGGGAETSSPTSAEGSEGAATTTMADGSTGSPATGDTSGGECVPSNAGEFTYAETDPEGRFLIDTLFVLTANAEAEIEGKGMTPEEFLAFRVDDINETLDRSLIDSSRVRYLGVHTLVLADHTRTGEAPGGPSQDIAQALAWLSSYRDSYGADKVAIIGATAENSGPAALGGGDVSAYWVDFVPFEHEVGHTMGGGHCHEPGPETNYGSPFNGYDASGEAIENGPLIGGTRMCGNSAAFFSNPDVTLDVNELESLAAEGLVPDQDYAAILGAAGTLTLGDAQFANMAQRWRDLEQSAAERLPTTMYPGAEAEFYEDDDCAGFFAGTGYQCLLFEVCAGETVPDAATLAGVGSVLLGRSVHLNLYSSEDFGEGSVFGGLRLRMAHSSPSLEAIADYHDVGPLGSGVGSAIAFHPDDREAHATQGGSFDYFDTGFGARVTLDETGAETLTLLPDDALFASAAALYRPSAEPPFAVDFEYSSFAAGGLIGDGMVVMFGKDGGAYLGSAPPRETVGFIPDGTGMGVRFSTFPSGSISVVDGNFSDIGAPIANPLAYTDGVFVAVRIEVTETAVRVLYDGVEQLNIATSTDSAFATLGIGVGTGAYTSESRVRNFSVSAL